MSAYGDRYYQGRTQTLVVQEKQVEQKPLIYAADGTPLVKDKPVGFAPPRETTE